MLKEITIRNFALIDDINLKLYDGLNIIMGETGSGKSNLIDSISILMGARALKDKIREGEDKAFISGIFDINDNIELEKYLKENNFYCEDEGLVISREIYLKSSTISKVNNIPVSSSALRTISSYLINIYGQFENISILSKSQQRDFLDSFGDNYHKENLLELDKLYNKFSNKKMAYYNYKKSPEEINSNLEFLLFQINDIESEGILEINEKELDNRLEILENFQMLRDITANLINLLDVGDHDIISSLGKVSNISETISNIDKDFIELANRINQVYIETEDIKREIKYYYESLNFDEEEYQKLDYKRKILFEAKRKYGNSIDKIKVFYENTKKKVNEIKNYEQNLTNIYEELINIEIELSELSQKISDERKVIAGKLREKLIFQLYELEITEAKFEIDFRTIPLGVNGIDEVTFMISFNKNESVKELASVASGGEISRFMLAIKSIEAEFENTPTIIFDEIDTGISGNTGNVVGNKLYNLSKHHQIICISHLPQIIAKGDYQFLVYKDEFSGKVKSNIIELDYEGRITEIAKVIEGNDYSIYTYKTAKKMLDNNKR